LTAKIEVSVEMVDKNGNRNGPIGAQAMHDVIINVNI